MKYLNNFYSYLKESIDLEYLKDLTYNLKDGNIQIYLNNKDVIIDNDLKSIFTINIILTSLKEITIDNGFGDKYNVFIDNFYWEIMEEVLSIKDRLINNSNIENIGVKMAEKSIMINVITKKQTDLLKKYLLLLNKKLIKPGVFTNSTYTYIINTGKVSDLIIRTKIDDYSQFDFDNFIKDVVDINKVTIEKEINDEFVINHIKLK